MHRETGSQVMDTHSLHIEAKRPRETEAESRGKRIKSANARSKQKQADIRTAMGRSTGNAALYSTITLPEVLDCAPTHPSTTLTLPSLTSIATNLILSSALSPYRQRVLLALCQVPHGQHTTYAALSAFLNSSPRAVGNAMRRNPFAPTVPCHRVLAADGGIGGFGGEWRRDGTEGEGARRKRALLRGEGVRFDGRGRVVGKVWRGWV